jgi:hypothetical protein
MDAACIGTAWQRQLSTAQRELGTAICSVANCRRAESIRDAVALWCKTGDQMILILHAAMATMLISWRVQRKSISNAPCSSTVEHTANGNSQLP